MPKVVESKLVFKGDDQISAKMDKINEAIAKMGNLAKEAAENLQGMMDAAMGGTGAPRGGRGRAAQGSQRSPNAPHPGGGIPSSRGSGRGGEDLKPFPGWHSWMKFAGMGMAAGGAVAGAIQSALTPVVAGAMGQIGSAISAISVAGLPVGAIPGLGLMAGGAFLGAQWQAAQPAIQHYAQHGAAMRTMGDYAHRGENLKAMQEAWTPDEQQRLKKELYDTGAQEAIWPLMGMRWGGGIFETEQMSKYYKAATRAGAAGGRGKEDYERLAKYVAIAFDRSKTGSKAIPSMTEAMDTMVGLMGVSETHLGDMKDDQTRYLAAMTNFMVTSGVAALKGQRGIQTMGSIAGAVAGEGSPAAEYMKWRAFQKAHPGGSMLQFQYWKEEPEAGMKTVEEYGAMGEWGPVAMAKEMGLSKHGARDLMGAWKRRDKGEFEKIQREELGGVKISFDTGEMIKKGPEFDLAKKQSEVKNAQMEISQTFAKGAMDFELACTNFAKTIEGILPLSKATGVFTDFVEALDRFTKSQTGVGRVKMTQEEITKAEDTPVLGIAVANEILKKLGIIGEKERVKAPVD